MLYQEEYKKWCESPIFDEETKKELQAIKNNEKEIEDRFYKELEFGTAGLRGIMGAGCNRMNKYSIGKATQALANFIKRNNKQEKGVVIAYDSRNNSKEFSEVVALVLNANGIKTYVFENIAPVPELSYSVRKLGCVFGIMITASHNPAKYNGYKVYGEDGAQITSPIDKELMEEVNKITDYKEIQKIEKQKALETGKYNIIRKEIEDNYIEEIKKQILNIEIIKKQENLSIVYTPLHGTGNKPVQRILKEIGFKNVHIVKEQEEPDGNFPTVEYPNPEDKNAFKLAIELAKKVNAEVVLATDPDADRLGVFIKNDQEYVPLTGNMSALLILEYILSQRKMKNTLPQNGLIIKSIVSSTMSEPIAKKYGVTLEEVLTGFKYIGEKIKENEQTKQYEFLFGYEESYGCLAGTHARDKDAIVAVMLLCEAAAYYKEQGISLYKQLQKMYKTYGYYQESVKQVTLEGIEGEKQIKEKLANLRSNPPKKIGAYVIKKIRDYQEQIIYNTETKQKEKIQLPKSNVIYYELEKEAWLAIRPSGTEPKIKYYIGVKEKSLQEAKQKLQEIEQQI